VIFLADHNLEGQAFLLWGQLATEGWLELLPLRLLTFENVSLSITSNDRVVWQFAQANQMLLLTGNRNRKGLDSLEQTIREENTPSSLPVITIARVDLLDSGAYRHQCIERLIEILLDLENYLGTGRLFIP
jgi:hypothetical protein